MAEFAPPADLTVRARRVAETIVMEMGADIGAENVLMPETWRRRISASIAVFAAATAANAARFHAFAPSRGTGRMTNTPVIDAGIWAAGETELDAKAGLLRLQLSKPLLRKAVINALRAALPKEPPRPDLPLWRELWGDGSHE